VSLFGRGKAEAQDLARAGRAESRAKGFFEDLLQLEINIIITPGMTARRMPELWDALANIAEGYDDLLHAFTVDVQRSWKENKSPRTQVFGGAAKTRTDRPPSHSMVDGDGRMTSIQTAGLTTGPNDRSGFCAFDDLRVRAVEASAVACALVATPGWPGAADLNQRVVLFKRIQRNCEQLQEILKDIPHMNADRQQVRKDISLTPAQLLTVRKIWEVGIATVVMQTVVHLDGDIVTRIHEGHESASSQPVHDIHRASVDSAIRNWQFLGQTVAQILNSVLRKFL